MDKQLQFYLKIRKLQDEVITLRTEIPAIYSKAFKRSQSIQLKRLFKVQIDIPVTEVEIPEQCIVPANENIQPKLKTEDIENDSNTLAKIYDFI